MTREQAVRFLIERPAEFGRMLGYTKLTDMHNKWIIEMVTNKEDQTIQAHRGSYKTTCVSIALALIIILLPNKRTMFMRKTDSDTKEIIRQVQKILRDEHTAYFVRCIYGVNISMVSQTQNTIITNLTSDMRGMAQLMGIGLGASITGKHFDFIFTDDIVNLNDRTSKAERERTKIAYMELQNIKNRGGKIVNTGTPWHKEDCFELMPNPVKYDCYTTGIMSKEDIEHLKKRMSPSLFAANYELKHIASEEAMFLYPNTGADVNSVKNGIAHVDSAFWGEDYTAFSVMAVHDGKFYLYGKLWRKHVEDCYDEIKAYYDMYLCSKLYNETNADKGMVAKDMRKKGMRVVTYSEGMNKHIKISTYLKAIWSDLYFVEGTDESYINQICDYTEDAEHDDAPDSAACLARLLYNKSKDEYKPLF